MRLKTKLVVTITGLVFLLVSVISWLYLSSSLQQNVDQNYASTDIIAHQVLFATRQAIEAGVRAKAIDPAAPPPIISSEMAGVLRQDAALSALMDSVISYSPTVFDITVTDSADRTLVSTDPVLGGGPLPYRPRYATLRFRSPLKIIEVVTGRPRVYDVPLELQRNGKPFATVHVGIRTSFLLEVFRPRLLEAFTLTGVAILTSLVVAAFVANLALAPLEQISRRLDALSGGAHRPARDGGRDGGRDEVLQVSSKIESIGQRMRNTEEVFSALKENLEQILSNLQDGMMLFTRDSRVVLVSRSVERFLGADRDQLLGASVATVFDHETVLGRLVRGAFEAGESIPSAEIETESGRRLEISLEMIESPDGARRAKESLGALLTMHDLESVREIEDELELSHRLAAIGRLTSGVGHEVKNPINAIVVHMELLRNKLASEEAPAIRHLDIIQSEIQRLDRVVQTLVDFSRPIEPKLQEQDLRGVVGSVLQLASAELATRSVRVVSRMPDRPVMVKIDADMMRQALLNIVLNGAQAMPAGGALTIELAEDSRFAILSVADQGEGIPAEVLPRIFDLYFTTRKEGSGIGLAMTYRIVQLHSGVVEVTSEIGQGSRFTLRIPCAHGGDARSRVLAGAGISGKDSRQGVVAQ